MIAWHVVVVDEPRFPLVLVPITCCVEQPLVAIDEM
jgi:hypothetical protein